MIPTDTSDTIGKTSKKYNTHGRTDAPELHSRVIRSLKIVRAVL